MGKITITQTNSDFEADILLELLKQNGIDAEIKNEEDKCLILISEIDKSVAEKIINNYNNPAEKQEVIKTTSLKSSIIKMLILIGGAVVFFYLMSLLFKLILELV